MIKSIGIAGALVGAVLGTSGPANAGIRLNEFKTTPTAYNSVSQRDDRSWVDLTLGHEGHRTNQRRDPAGNKLVTFTYPASIDGDTVKAVYVRYAPFRNHPTEFVWALSTKSWCVGGVTCSADAPSA